MSKHVGDQLAGRRAAQVRSLPRYRDAPRIAEASCAMACGKRHRTQVLIDGGFCNAAARRSRCSPAIATSPSRLVMSFRIRGCRWRKCLSCKGNWAFVRSKSPRGKALSPVTRQPLCPLSDNRGTVLSGPTTCLTSVSQDILDGWPRQTDLTLRVRGTAVHAGWPIVVGASERTSHGSWILGAGAPA